MNRTLFERNMVIRRRLLSAAVPVLVSLHLAAQQKPVAAMPPMGWNSYNCYGASVREQEVRDNADYMAENLKAHGWEYVVVDFCWFYPHPPGSRQSPPPQFRLPMDGAPVPWLAMDEYGRLLPDPGKFPSAANGAGFKALADYVHGKGLKFGIHIMRGIPRQAVWAKSPVLGAPGITADMIADTNAVCPWLNSMYGVNMDKAGAQAYYNSIFRLYADWGVDFVKMDDVDLDENYPYRRSEVEAARKAIDQCGRPMVLSLSLHIKWENREHVAANAQMWRISFDFWDNWKQLEAQFEQCARWAPVSRPGAFPDADMLQIGKLSKRGPVGEERFSRFTDDELRTHFTLWCIFRSPLMMGGNLPENTPFVTELLCNDEVLAVDQQGYDARQLYRRDDVCVWTSRMPGSQDLNVAVFNLADTPRTVTVSLAELGLSGRHRLRDLWTHRELGDLNGSINSAIAAHGAKLYRVH